MKKLSTLLFLFLTFAPFADAQAVRRIPMYPAAGGGGSGDITWNNTQNFSVTGNDWIHSTAGYYMHANSDQAISTNDDTEYLQFEVANAGIWDMYIAPASGAPYSSTPTASVQLSLNNLNLQINLYSGGWGYASDFSITTGDVIRINFNGSGNMRIYKNGGLQWTSGGTFSGDHMIYVEGQNETPLPAANNCVYQVT